MSLRFDNLTVSYGNFTAIKDVSATIESGSVTALIGPNGAGKSSLLRAVSGLLPASGTVSLNDQEVAVKDRRTALSYMPQDTSANSSLTLIEVVLLGRIQTLGLSVPTDLIRQAEAALQRFGLESLQARTLDAVSGGQRQLVFLAQAMFREPQALLLDEPTAALDLRHQLIVLDAVRAQTIARDIPVVMAMHDLSLAAQFADCIVCLSGSKIDAVGPANEVLTTERLRRLYGVEAEIETSRSGHRIVVPVKAIAS